MSGIARERNWFAWRRARSLVFPLSRPSVGRRRGEAWWNAEEGCIRSGSRWLREISLFSDITPVIVMPSNWIRFVHPRETAGISLNIPSFQLAATMDCDSLLPNSSNVFNFFLIPWRIWNFFFSSSSFFPTMFLSRFFPKFRRNFFEQIFSYKSYNLIRVIVITMNLDKCIRNYAWTEVKCNEV